MKRLFFLIAMLLLAGCGGPILLVHPKTGERITCSGSDNPNNRLAPAVGVLTINRYTESCARQYEGLGFVRADNLTPEQRANLTSRPTPIGIEQDITIRQAPAK